MVDAGSIVVAASGNSNVDTSTFVPGGCPASITVAAYDSSLKRASFSNYGNKIDVAAPGVGVYSTYPSSKGSYKQLSGTSMATPHIVGLVSLMLEQDSSLRSTNIKELFKKYPLSVSPDAGKYIASGVNVSEMMSYLQTREEDGEVKEEVIREIQEESENTERQDNIQKSQIQDDAELDETLTLQENS